ncbi:P-loop containing nucleoside triphosphate hydrolase protein, partial [Lineolata rhizophorae]
MGAESHLPPDQELYVTYRSHNSGSRIHTDTTIQSALLEQYPDKCLTCTHCDLIKFAEEGNATAAIVKDGPPRLFRRDFAPANNTIRLAGDRVFGRLNTQVTFGCYDYVWTDPNGQELTFLIYVVEGQSNLGGICDRRYYILKEPAEGEVVGQASSAAADELIMAAGIWSERSHNEVWVFDQGRWLKDKALWAAVQDAEMDDIILDEQMKLSITRDVLGFFDAKDVYAQFGTPWKRGLIFHGPPGNGKTMTLKAVMRMLMAREEPMSVLYVKTLAQRSFGPQQSCRSIFSKARQVAPCLLIFEDIDSLVTDAVRSYFFNEVDGLEINTGIVMIGSTNNLDKLDAGLSKRPSRFDRKYRFDNPQFEERLRYCEYWSSKLSSHLAAHVTSAVPHRVASLTEGFSFAYVKEAYISSLLIL